jgi:hypothetical protein
MLKRTVKEKTFRFHKKNGFLKIYNENNKLILNR